MPRASFHGMKAIYVTPVRIFPNVWSTVSELELENNFDPPSSQSIFLPHQQLQKLVARHSCSCANCCFPMPILFPLVLFCNSQCRIWWGQNPCLKSGSKMWRENEPRLMIRKWWTGFFCLLFPCMSSVISVVMCRTSWFCLKLPALRCVVSSLSWEPLAYFSPVSKVVVHLLLPVRAICVYVFNSQMEVLWEAKLALFPPFCQRLLSPSVT